MLLNFFDFFDSLIELSTLHVLSWCIIAFGVVTFFLLQKQKAPYGRYASEASIYWGPNIPAKLAWMLQEMPCFLWPLYFLMYHPPLSQSAHVLLLCFFVHYAHRTFIFSLRIRGGKPTKLVPFIMAFFFCFINGYLQTCFLAKYFVLSASNVFMQGMFGIGLMVFFLGMAINIHSDGILRNLRSDGDSSHKIPRGGVFSHVSAANFFGEILEWIGFAMATGFSLPAVAFAFFTFANIGPRGKQHHEDYLRKFADYPKNRKAVIPFLW